MSGTSACGRNEDAKSTDSDSYGRIEAQWYGRASDSSYHINKVAIQVTIQFILPWRKQRMATLVRHKSSAKTNSYC